MGAYKLFNHSVFKPSSPLFKIWNSPVYIRLDKKVKVFLGHLESSFIIVQSSVFNLISPRLEVLKLVQALSIFTNCYFWVKEKWQRLCWCDPGLWGFEIAQWRKVKQMQPMWLCILWLKWKDFHENNWSALENLRMTKTLLMWPWPVGIWNCTVEKSQTNATNVTMHPLLQAIWGHIWKDTVEKSQTNAANVTMHPFMPALWGHI